MKLCTQCYNKVEPKREVRGYFLIEIALWFLFILPGLIYTVWRVIGGREEICPECNGKSFVPLDSPAAKSLLSNIPKPGNIHEVIR